MESANPYSPPAAGVADASISPTAILRLNRIAANQRMMIYAVVASFFTGPLRTLIGEAALFVGIVASLMAIVGAVRLSAALGHAILARVLFALLMIVPLVNLIAMLVLSSRATKELRAGGYRVGLFGARPHKA